MSGRPDQPFLETPRGILSRAGVVFHTTVADLERQYGEVLGEVPLERLIDRAELWLVSHRALTLWSLIPLLIWLSLPFACVLVLAVFVFWKSIAPALGNARLEKPIRVLSSVGGQLVGYVIAMSWLGATGDYAALTAGLIGFALIRWQALDYLFKPVTEAIQKRLFPLPVADQMLRAVIHSEAIKLRIRLPHFPSISRWMSDGDPGTDR